MIYSVTNDTRNMCDINSHHSLSIFCGPGSVPGAFRYIFSVNHQTTLGNSNTPPEEN